MGRITLQPEALGTLAICAIRYCQGRETYMPDCVRGIIRPFLQDITDNDLAVLLADCDFQRRMHLYGDEKIDLPGWLKWEQELQREKERRKTK